MNLDQQLINRIGQDVGHPGLIRQLMHELGQIQDVDLALETILKYAQWMSGARRGAAVAFDLGGQVANRVAAGLSPDMAHQSWRHARQAFESPSIRWITERPEAAAPPDGSGISRPDPGPPAKGLILPLVRHQVPLGAVTLYLDDRTQLEGEAQAWLDILASASALTLENLRLFDAALQQGSELSVFYESAAGVDTPQDVSALLDSILDRTQALLAADGVSIHLLARTPRIVPHGSAIGPARASGMEIHPAEGRKIAQHVLRESTAVVVQEVEADAYVLAAPMAWRQGTVGVLQLIKRASAGSFIDAEVKLASLIASQAGSAISIAYLIESERSQRRMAMALQEAALSVSRQLDLDDVLDQILAQVMRAFPCEAANFQVFEAGRSRILRSQGYDQFGLSINVLSGTSLSLEDYPSLRSVEAGEAVFIEDTRESGDWVERPGFEWLRAWAGVPVMFAEDLLGCICLDSSQPGAFDESTLEGLGAFAAHAAVAMRNARLYERLLNEHRRLQQVYEIGQKLSGSLDPEAIVSGLVEGCLQTLGGLFGAAYLVDEDGRAGLRLAVASPREGPNELLRAHKHLPRLLDEVQRALAVIEEEFAYPSGDYWLAGFPIFVGDQARGVGVIWFTPGAGRDKGLNDVLAAVGQQAGLALANAEKHAQVGRRLAELTLLQRVVNAIAQRLEVDAVLKEVTEQLHRKLGYPAIQILWRDGEDLFLRSFSGPRPIANRAAIGAGVAGRVVRTGESALVSDVRRDPDYIPTLAGTRAQLAVPIRQDETVVGVINIETADPSQLKSESLELLSLLADQVSIAVQNAGLYQQVRSNVETLEARVRERTSQLEQVLEQARAAERAKAQFVADVSHELRTPLTNIGLYLDLLDLGEASRRQDYMGTLRRETQRLGMLIEQLLSIAQLDTDQVTLTFEPVDVNALIRVLVSDRQPLLARRSLKLNLELDADLPPAEADGQYLLQVMTNLLTNAMNYTPPGGKIWIRSRLEESDDIEQVVFEVSDTGPGVSADERGIVFDRFFRGAAGRASGVAGTGLGLAISKEIVDRHDGEIRLLAPPGGGATFSVRLPRRRSA